MLMRFALFLFFYAASIMYAQDSSDTDKSFIKEKFETAVQDAGLYFTNCSAFFLAPVSADRDDWFYAAGITGATVLLFSQDDEIRRLIGRNTLKPINGDWWDIPTVYGVVEYANIFSAAVYAGGLLSSEDKVKNTGRLLMETITVSGVTALFLRWLTGRIRPPYSNDHMDFQWFETTEKFHSFPSGHAVVGVALSTVLAEQIDTWWSRTFFYGMAFLSSFVRIYNNQHWFTDVTTGSLLGLGAGLFMVNREKAGTESFFKNKLSVIPGANGINFIYSF